MIFDICAVDPHIIEVIPPWPPCLNTCASHGSCLDGYQDVIVNCEECVFPSSSHVLSLIILIRHWRIQRYNGVVQLPPPKRDPFNPIRNPSTIRNHKCVAILRVQHFFLPVFFKCEQFSHFLPEILRLDSWETLLNFHRWILKISIEIG